MPNDPANPMIAVRQGDQEFAHELYSPEGMALVASLWLKLSAEFRRMYRPSWLGVPIIQLPEDIVQMQELLWRERPDAVIETGVAHGGSLVLTASLLELVGQGRVLGIDIEIRQHNRVALDAHPLRHRIDLIEGSSVAPEVVERARAFCAGARKVLVVLDSNHSAEHVYEELCLYRDLVTPGSYLVAMDGAQALVADIPRGNPAWSSDNPLVAINRFLDENPDFQVDPHFTRLDVTSSPSGFLRRLTGEELKRLRTPG